ncbi:CPBP family intramembrane glutamic endopeptidase [Fictibacillus iocasae]|uniref:CPBP family intramembrane glutamic endopeptidase n=1 Tax=Fictibacillus iocasae TaxID=2715437 RepID=A0ABW2NL71_9BACL
MNQRNVQHLTAKELIWNVYVSQLIFLAAAVLLSIFFELEQPWRVPQQDGLGFIPVVLASVACALFLSLAMKKRLVRDKWDDGGINEILFSSLSGWHIWLMAAVIAFCEEYLFRGALQPLIGITGSSLIFAFLHFRYVNKPYLLLFVVLLSLWLGVLYEYSGTIWMPFLFHFLFDAISGMLLAKESKKNTD